MFLKRHKEQNMRILKEKGIRNKLILESLYFDGRKGNIVLTETKGKQIYRKIIKEEFMFFVLKPGSE